MPTSRNVYQVGLLPKWSTVPAAVLAKFKALRLEALRTLPSEFLPSHVAEAGFSDAHWEQHINDPLNHYLICYMCEHSSKYLPSGDDDAEINGARSNNWVSDDEWVGMLILAGSFSPDQYSVLVPAALGPEEGETRWLLGGLYVQPNHRCQQIWVAISEAVLGHLRMWTDMELDTAFDPMTGMERGKRARMGGLHAAGDTALGSTIGHLTSRKWGRPARKQSQSRARCLRF